jgi:hypothetical protein
MAIGFHIMAANGALTGVVRERLNAALNETAAAWSALLDLADVEAIVSVLANRRRANPPDLEDAVRFSASRPRAFSVKTWPICPFASIASAI